MSTYDDEARAGKHWCFVYKLTIKIMNVTIKLPAFIYIEKGI